MPSWTLSALKTRVRRTLETVVWPLSRCKRRERSQGTRNDLGSATALPQDDCTQDDCTQDDCTSEEDLAEAEPVELTVDGALDLHQFVPRDVRRLVPDYLAACQARGILEVRVIHGKGKGHLRRSVHALLARLPTVASYRLAPPERGGWGATLVNLRPAPRE